MNGFTYENQGSNTYLVYSVAEDEVIDSLGLGMITNNSISGLAQTTCIQMNNQKFIKYNVSAKISVSQFFSGAINKARLLGVFKGIVDALINAEDYMIDPNMLMLDLDYIFSDVSTCETVLICLPIIKLDRPHTDLGMFFKNIMFTSQFDQTENCDYVAKIMNHLNSTPAFSLVDFKKVVEQLMNDEETLQKKSYQKEETKSNIAVEVKVNNDYVASSVQRNPQPSVLNVHDVQTTASKEDIEIKQKEPLSNGFNPFEEVEEKEEEEKEMSMLYLMQHYTKENKAIYDSQKGKKKSKSKNDKNSVSEEKPMSKFYLLQHYTKENKAIYDAQQAAKKNDAKKSQGVSKGEIGKKSTNSSNASSNVNMDFLIPGQAVKNISSLKATQKEAVNISHERVVKQNEIEQIKKEQFATKAEEKKNYDALQKRSVINSSPMSFGETVVLNSGSIGDTTVLNSMHIDEKPIAVPRLIRLKNNQVANINKPVFRIGKEKSYVDYFIGDNSAISRSHANIIIRSDRYFVVDTNSTNHTYIDGNILQSNSEYEIVDGSKLRLANEDFEFKVY